MKVYEILTDEQLEKHREVLLWILAEVDWELAKREKNELEPSVITIDK